MIAQTVFNAHPPHIYQKTTPENHRDETLYDLITKMLDHESFEFDIKKTPSYQSLEKLEKEQKERNEMSNQRERKWSAEKAQSDLKLKVLEDALNEIKQEINSFPSSDSYRPYPLTQSLNHRKEGQRVDGIINSIEEQKTQKATDARFQRIDTIQYETFGLIEEEKILIQQNEAASLACKSLQEQWEVLREQQIGYQRQIQLYQDQVSKKEAQERETLEKERQVKNEINTFLKAKRETLEQFVKNIDTIQNNELSSMESQFSNQINQIQQAMNQDLENLSSINQKALSAIQRLYDRHLQEIQATQDRYLNQMLREVNNARSYVHGKRFTIRNTKVNEYLYAARYAPKELPDRRYVFCWEGGQEITQGYWAIVPDSKDTFSFKNTTHEEYLFASNYKPFSDAYPARTWKPRTLVQEAYWLLEPLGNHRFRLFNTYYKKYLCVSSRFTRNSDDDKRRTVVAGEEADIWEIRSAGTL